VTAGKKFNGSAILGGFQQLGQDGQRQNERSAVGRHFQPGSERQTALILRPIDEIE
jgi:hypothetical protein